MRELLKHKYLYFFWTGESLLKVQVYFKKNLVQSGLKKIITCVWWIITTTFIQSVNENILIVKLLCETYRYKITLTSSSSAKKRETSKRICVICTIFSSVF